MMSYSCEKLNSKHRLTIMIAAEFIYIVCGLPGHFSAVRCFDPMDLFWPSYLLFLQKPGR